MGVKPPIPNTLCDASGGALSFGSGAVVNSVSRVGLASGRWYREYLHADNYTRLPGCNKCAVVEQMIIKNIHLGASIYLGCDADARLHGPRSGPNVSERDGRRTYIFCKDALTIRPDTTLELLEYH